MVIGKRQAPSSLSCLHGRAGLSGRTRPGARRRNALRAGVLHDRILSASGRMRTLLGTRPDSGVHLNNVAAEAEATRLQTEANEDGTDGGHPGIEPAGGDTWGRASIITQPELKQSAAWARVSLQEGSPRGARQPKARWLPAQGLSRGDGPGLRKARTAAQFTRTDRQRARQQPQARSTAADHVKRIRGLTSQPFCIQQLQRRKSAIIMIDPPRWHRDQAAGSDSLPRLTMQQRTVNAASP